MRVPSEEQCIELLKENNVPKNVLAHSKKVTEFAVGLAKQLKANGIKVNIELVRAGALLHDLDKIYTLKKKGRHGFLAEEILEGKGLHEIAVIARKHVLENVTELESIEEKLVFYADKRVIDNRIVSLKERLDFILKKYGTTEKARADFKASKPAIFALERELMQMVK